jgi:hypothetical protein
MSLGPPRSAADATRRFWPGTDSPETPADRHPIRDQRTAEQRRAAKHRRRMARQLALYLREPKRRRPSAARALELRSRLAAGLERLEERS